MMANGPHKSEREAQADEVRVGWRMLGLAMQTSAEVAAGALIGWLFDRWLGTTQGVVIGASAGILVGLWSLVRGSMKMMRDLDRRHPPGSHTPKKPVRPILETRTDPDDKAWDEGKFAKDGWDNDDGRNAGNTNDDDDE